jgi:hypothetical protein
MRQPIFLLAFSLGIGGSLPAQMEHLRWERVDMPELPPSIELYRTSTRYPPGSELAGLPIHAVCAVIDLNDSNLEWRMANRKGGERLTPLAFAEAEDEPVYVAVNGGFFNADSVVNVVIDQGRATHLGLWALARQQQWYYPTWGALGQMPDGALELTWTYPGGEPPQGDGTVLCFNLPYPNDLNRPPLPRPQPGRFSFEGQDIIGEIWTPLTATGGHPALVIDGEVQPSIGPELVQESLRTWHPRTAIGYTIDNKLMLMVVDGRQPTRSIGARLEELAAMMRDRGARGALNLDGGGSSAMIAGGRLLTYPSDQQEMRPVAGAILIRRRARIYDTDDALRYFEEGDVWNDAPLLEGHHGVSPARQARPDDTPGRAGYVFAGLPPAEYELAIWRVGAEHLSGLSPFTLRRGPLGAPQSFLVDQRDSSRGFQILGTFHLGPGDSLLLDTPAADGRAVAIDAARLRKVGESLPFLHVLPSADKQVRRGANAFIPLLLGSLNSGVTPRVLSVYRQWPDTEETLLGQPMPLAGLLLDSIAVYLPAFEENDMVRLRFELEDNLGRTVSAFHAFTVEGAARAAKLDTPLHWSVFPNPSFGPFQASGRLPRPTRLFIDVHDVFGRLIERRALGLVDQFDFAGELKGPAGAYSVILKGEGKLWAKTILLKLK